jgi:hypothetical protein
MSNVSVCMLIFAFRPSVVRRTNTPVLDAYFCLPDTPREITYIMSGFRECFSTEVYRVAVRSFTDLEGEKMVRDTRSAHFTPAGVQVQASLVMELRGASA